MGKEDFDKLVEEKRAETAQNIWDKFLSPQVSKFYMIVEEMAKSSELVQQLQPQVLITFLATEWKLLSTLHPSQVVGEMAKSG